MGTARIGRRNRPVPTACFRWWVTGGHALELHTGRSWRSRDDTDISFCRSHAAAARELLDDWDIHVAAAGALTPWDGGPLRGDLSQNNLWCRRTPLDPWALDLTVSDGDDTHWINRRDRSLRVVWDHAVLLSPHGTPYLSPELQLLFKSKNHRPKDDVDLLEMLQELDSGQNSFLLSQLPTDHPWLAFLQSG